MYTNGNKNGGGPSHGPSMIALHCSMLVQTNTDRRESTTNALSHVARAQTHSDAFSAVQPMSLADGCSTQNSSGKKSRQTWDRPFWDLTWEGFILVRSRAKEKAI